VAPGIIRTRVGFTGGTVPNPTYRNLGDHTEAIDLDYDPKVISYETLVAMFWRFHDPTVQHKKQYMSAIFYHDEEQQRLAEESKQQQQKLKQRPIQTQIQPMQQFYNAEDYHQKYLLRCQSALFNALGLDGAALIRSHVAAKVNGYCGGYASEQLLQQEAPVWGLSEKQTQLLREAMAHGANASCGL